MSKVYKLNYKVVWNGHGFDPDKLPEKEFKVMEREFMNAYNAYCELSNTVIDEANQTWERIEKVVEAMVASGKFGDYLSCMDIVWDGIPKEKRAYNYADWMEIIMRNCVEALNQYQPNPMWEGFIFRDGDISVFGGRLKSNPNWSMDFSLVSGR